MEPNIPQEQLFTQNPDTPSNPLQEHPQGPLPKNVIIIFIVVGVISFIATVYLLFGKTILSTLSKTQSSNPSIRTVSITITPPQITSAEINITKPSITPAKKPSLPTATPSSIKTTNPTSTIKPTSTPTPTPTTAPTPTRTPNPPQVNIVFPQQDQIIYSSNNPGDHICLADSPYGGDLTGVLRKRYLDSTGWSAYESIGDFCFTPSEGDNVMGVQYKNQYGDQSGVQYRRFSYFYD